MFFQNASTFFGKHGISFGKRRGYGADRVVRPYRGTWRTPSPTDGGAAALGDGFPRQCEHWLGMTALRAVGRTELSAPTEGRRGWRPIQCREPEKRGAFPALKGKGKKKYQFFHSTYSSRTPSASAGFAAGAGAALGASRFSMNLGATCGNRARLSTSSSDLARPLNS